MLALRDVDRMTAAIEAATLALVEVQEVLEDASAVTFEETIADAVRLLNPVFDALETAK